MKRYNIRTALKDTPDDEIIYTIEPADSGQWVRYEDYLQLRMLFLSFTRSGHTAFEEDAIHALEEADL